MKAKSKFLAWNALPSPTSEPASPHDDCPGLPMATLGGKISPERSVIRWMPAYAVASRRGAVMHDAEQRELPSLAWGTKGFVFWTFLSVLLKETRPRAILELGSGRSSAFFADYAYAFGAAYVGIESDLRWFNKTTLDIDLLGFGKRHVAHVGLARDGSWYDPEGFRKATANPGRFDFALIDAPNEKQFFTGQQQVEEFFRPEVGNPFGHRDDPAGLAAIKSVAGNCDIMMVDDVHKLHLYRTVDAMLGDPGSYEKYYFVYHPHLTTTNGLCICLKRSAPVAQRFTAILGLLNLRLARGYRPPDA